MNGLLEVRNISVDYRLETTVASAVRNVSFEVYAGESVGIIGESGCGKTTLMKAILRLSPKYARVTGEVLFEGKDLLQMSNKQLRQVRWKEISLVPQSAMNSLDPVYTVGAQIIEAIRTHEKVSLREARKRSGQLLRLVGVSDRRLNDYPHQLSGGTKQRICLAMALALNPKLLIADEPTTALDVVVQDHILEEIRQLRQKFGMALIMVTHDISVVAESCDRVVVMYGGEVMESGRVSEVFTDPLHPYVMGLLNSFPRLTGSRSIVTIPGVPPDPGRLGGVCAFADRCPFATDICFEKQPEAIRIREGRTVACHHWETAADMRELAKVAKTWENGVAVSSQSVS